MIISWSCYFCKAGLDSWKQEGGEGGGRRRKGCVKKEGEGEEGVEGVGRREK